MYLSPDDSLWLGWEAVCFNKSGGCEDIIYSQVMTSHELFWNVHHLKAQQSQTVQSEDRMKVFEFIWNIWALWSILPPNKIQSNK